MLNRKLGYWVILWAAIGSFSLVLLMDKLPYLNGVFGWYVLLYIGFLRVDSTAVRDLGYFAPSLLILLLIGSAYAVGQLAYLWLADLGLTHYRSDAAVLTAARAIIIALGSVLVGQVLPCAMANTTARCSRHSCRKLSRARTYVVVAIMVLFGYVGFIYFVWERGVPILYDDIEMGRIAAVRGMNYVFAAILQLVNASLLVVVLFYPRRRVRMAVVLGILFVPLVAMGYRSPVGAVLVFMLMWHSFAVGRIGFARGVLLMQLLLAAAVTVGMARSLFSGGAPGSWLLHWLVSTSVQFREIAFALDELPSRLMGSTYLAGVLLFIPRALLPSKPDGMGLYLRDVLYSSGFQGGGVRVSQFGEALLNFGYVGVIVGMVLLGLGAFWVTRYLRQAALRRTEGRMYAIFVGLIILRLLLTAVATDFAGIVFALFRDGVVLLAIARFCFPRHHGPPPAPCPQLARSEVPIDTRKDTLVGAARPEWSRDRSEQ